MESQSEGAFNVVFSDLEAFMKKTGRFFFAFSSKERPDDLIEKTRTAGARIGTPLHEYPESPYMVLSNIKHEPFISG